VEPDSPWSRGGHLRRCAVRWSGRPESGTAFVAIFCGNSSHCSEDCVSVRSREVLLQNPLHFSRDSCHILGFHRVPPLLCTILGWFTGWNDSFQKIRQTIAGSCERIRSWLARFILPLLPDFDVCDITTTILD
jgi:hypothetical protein